jgi:hypothetical protein
MTALFQRMSEKMPEHLVDHIAKQVHRVFTKDVFQELQMLYSPFEKLFMENEDVFDSLIRLYPDMEVRVDSYYYWITVVLKLTDTKFIVWHEYQEYVNKERFLMEGEVKENTYLFTKFAYIGEGRHLEICDDVEKYQQKQSKNIMPFQFLNYCMKNDHCVEDNVYKNAKTHGKWMLLKKIMDVFDNVLWEEYIDDEWM